MLPLRRVLHLLLCLCGLLPLSLAEKEARALTAPRAISSSSSSIDVGWDQPSIPGIKDSEYFYKLKYCRADQQSDQGWETTGEDVWEVLDDHITDTHYQVSGLQPNTLYYFKVKCHFPHDRWGPYSEPGIASTVGETKASSGNGVPDKPGAPVVSKETDTYVILSWEPPFSGGAPIDSYSIYVRTLLSDDWKLGKDNIKRNSVKVGNLKAKVDYVFSVKAHNANGWSSSSEPSAPYRLLPAVTVPSAPTVPTSSSSTSSSITISWSIGQQPMGVAKPDRFKVKYRLADNNGDTSWESPGHDFVDTSLEVTGLEPNTQYIFVVKAHNTAGWGPYSAESQPYSTRQASEQHTVPAAPDAPQVSQITTNSAVVTWNEPNGFGKAVNRYKIKYKVAFDARASWSETPHDLVQRSYTLQGLLPDTQYVAIVKAHNDVGWGPYSEESVPFQTSNGGSQLPPDAPRPPQLVSSTASSITLSYSAPNDHGSPVDRFKIKYHAVDHKKAMYEEWLTASDQITGTTYTVDGLKDDTEYVFIVKAHNQGHWGPYSESSQPMSTKAVGGTSSDHAVPPAPAAPSAVMSSSRAAIVSWEPPAARADPVDRYKVKYRQAHASLANAQWQSTSRHISQTHVLIPSLKPDTEYVFIVKAHNSVGWGPYSEESAPLLVGTGQSAANKPLAPGRPEPFVETGTQAAHATSTSIAIEWRVLEDSRVDAMPVDSFMVEYKEVNSQLWKTSTSEAIAVHWEVTGLKPKTQYVFRVSAHSDNGWSDPSEVSAPIATPAYFDSVPATPDQPTVSAVTATSVLLTWKSVAGHGLTVDYYVVEKLEAYTSGAAFTVVNSEIEGTTYEVTGLQPDTEYFFRVAARNSIGWSLKSRLTHVVRTAASSAETVPDVPLPPTATAAVDSTSITIQWRPPATCSAPKCMIDRYKVKFHVVGMPIWETASNHIVGTSYKVTGLDPDVEYVFIVKAHNLVGWGAYSHESTPIATLPEEVDKNEVESVSEEEFKHLCTLAKLPSQAPSQAEDGTFRFTMSRLEYPSHGSRDSDQMSFSVVAPSLFRALVRSDPLLGDVSLRLVGPSVGDKHSTPRGDLADTGIIGLEPSQSNVALEIQYFPRVTPMTHLRCSDFEIEVSLRPQQAVLASIQNPVPEAKPLDIPSTITVSPGQTKSYFNSQYLLPYDALTQQDNAHLRLPIKLDLQGTTHIAVQVGYNFLLDDFAVMLHYNDDEIVVDSSLPILSSPANQDVDHYHVMTSKVEKGSYTILLTGSDYSRSEFKKNSHVIMLSVTLQCTEEHVEDSKPRLLAIVPPTAADIGTNDVIQLHAVFSEPVMAPHWTALHDTMVARQAASLRSLGGGRLQEASACEYVGGQGESAILFQFEGPFALGDSYRFVLQSEEFESYDHHKFLGEPASTSDHVYKIGQSSSKPSRVVVVPTGPSGSPSVAPPPATPAPKTQTDPASPSFPPYHDLDATPTEDLPPAPLPTAPRDDSPVEASPSWAGNLLVAFIFIVSLAVIVAVVMVRRSRRLYQQYHRVDDGDELEDMESLLDD